MIGDCIKSALERLSLKIQRKTKMSAENGGEYRSFQQQTGASMFTKNIFKITGQFDGKNSFQILV